MKFAQTLILASAVTLAACSSPPEVTAPAAPTKPTCGQQLRMEWAPEWKCGNYPAGYAVAADGEAQPNPGNDRAFQKDIALANARDRMAADIATKVERAIDTFKRNTAVGTDQRYGRNEEIVSNQMSVAVLNNSHMIDMFIDERDVYHVLVGIKTEDFKQQLEQNLSKSDAVDMIAEHDEAKKQMLLKNITDELLKN